MISPHLTRRSSASTAIWTALLVGGISLVFAATLLAGDGSRQAAELKLTESHPGRVTGLKLRVDYRNPGDPDGKPPAVRRVVTKLPPGGRYDTRAPARCPASDAELMAAGTSACPAESIVGVGYIKIDTGLPGSGRFVEADVVFLNEIDELIFLSTVRGSGARAVTRAEVEEQKTISEAPLLPGTPPDGGAIDRVRVIDFPIRYRRGGQMRQYIRTPPRCPRRGFWITRTRFVYDDGVAQVRKTRNPCERVRR